MQYQHSKFHKIIVRKVRDWAKKIIIIFFVVVFTSIYLVYTSTQSLVQVAYCRLFVKGQNLGPHPAKYFKGFYVKKILDNDQMKAYSIKSNYFNPPCIIEVDKDGRLKDNYIEEYSS